jgi:FMN-dependent NADH-azoreductase
MEQLVQKPTKKLRTILIFFSIENCKKSSTSKSISRFVESYRTKSLKREVTNLDRGNFQF